MSRGSNHKTSNTHLILAFTLVPAAFTFLLLLTYLFVINPDRDKDDYCKNKLGKTEVCSQKAVKDILEKKGVEAALKFVIDSTKNNSLNSVSCHRAMHLLGIWTFNKNHDIRDALSRSNLYCTGGFLHGVLEAYVIENGKTTLREKISTVCTLDERDYAFRYECFHGLGHALMFVENGNIFNAIKQCDMLPDTFTRERCYKGAFMENSYQHEDAYSRPNKSMGKMIKKDDPYYPCYEVAEKYKPACYSFPGRNFLLDIISSQHSWFKNLTVDDFSKAYTICKNIEGPEQYQRSCMIDIPIYMRASFDRDWNKIHTVCNKLDTFDDRNLCFRSSGVAIRRYDYQKLGLGNEFCNSLQIMYRQDCLISIKRDLWYPAIPE